MCTFIYIYIYIYSNVIEIKNHHYIICGSDDNRTENDIAVNVIFLTIIDITFYLLTQSKYL